MKLTVTKISDCLYEFNESMVYPTGEEAPYVDAYLYIGDYRAAMIDCLQTCEDLYDRVREITDLPVDLLITHGHGDHAGASLKKFVEAGCRVYMDPVDYDILTGFGAEFGGMEIKREWFLPLCDGQEFFLGDKTLITYSCPGHSPGCVVFFDRENKLLFSGDSIGSGNLWMQIPSCLPLMLFEQNVKKLLDTLVPYGLDDILIYPGHRIQSPVQLTGQYVRDCWHIAYGVVNGLIEGEEQTLDVFGMHMEFRQVSYGMMVSFCYDPKHIGFFPGKEEDRAHAEALKDQFTKEHFQDKANGMNYMLFTPKLEAGKKYPLVVYLHGGGECGDDPRKALGNNGGWIFAEPDWQAKHPCYIIAPQVAMGCAWVDEAYTTIVRDLVMKMGFTTQVDSARVYITGLSLGGAGTWKMISLYPDLFAAAVPICGAGDPFAVRNAKFVPVWAAHAVDDPVVCATGEQKGPFAKKAGQMGSRLMVNSLRGAGNENVHYTEYPEGYMASLNYHPHWSWIPTYENEEIKEWMFAQSREQVYQIEMVRPGFYHIEDFGDDAIYLVEGTERALVIDTGLAENDFMGMVKSLTNLPVDLALTHAHPDHAYHLDKFDRYYMNEKDLPLIEQMYTKNPALPEEKRAAYAKTQLIPVNDGDIIDLGGGYEVEIFELTGHTPGSIVLLDKKRGYAMIGDATGVWMQVPGATGIAEYKRGLEHFLDRISAPEYKDVVFMNGHRKQEDASFKYGMTYTPNNVQKVRDMITLCDLLLKGLIPYKKYDLQLFGETAYCASYGQANIVFDMTHLKK